MRPIFLRENSHKDMTLQPSKPVSVLMVAIGGYGYYYLKTLLEEFPPGEVELAGVVDPNPQLSGHYQSLVNLGTPIFPTIEEFFQSGRTADLTVIASPIHYHAEQSITALKNGSHVLCDKPVAVTVQDVDEMISARDASGRWLMVGYQWSYSDAIQSLKRDILHGAFGKPRRMKTLRLWLRDEAYYRRNDWAGKIRDKEGRWILDSPANNAMAHYLHNMLYLLGDDIHLSAKPVELTAEVYRALDIENYDTVACRILTDRDVELLFYASHATEMDVGTIFELEFEKARITFDEQAQPIIAIGLDGKRREYGSPNDDHQFRKLFQAVRAVHEPQSITCGAEAARALTLCVNGIQDAISEITSFPGSMLVNGAGGKRWVKGLDEALLRCYSQGKQPFELGFTWAYRGKTINLSDYRYYPGGVVPGKTW
jgi:predicted dehydrogenase